MFGITLITFVIMRLAPGDPASIRFGAGGEQGAGMSSESGGVLASEAKFRKDRLLDQPLWKQYLHYMGPFDLSEQGHSLFGGTGESPWGGVLLLDLETEYHSKEPVLGKLIERLKVTIPFAFISITLSYLIALPLGIWSVVRQGTRRDGTVMVIVFLLYSIPTFWAGLMMQLVFGANLLDVLPIIGLHHRDAETFLTGPYLWDLFKHAILPLACMTYGTFAYLSRQMRAGMIETIRQDYIRTARAKGLSERVVILKHALRNSMIPVITLFASALPLLIGGSLIVEVVFQINGMGRYAFEGLLLRDYNIVMATTTFSAVMTLFGVLFSDITYALVDPRISYD